MLLIHSVCLTFDKVLSILTWRLLEVHEGRVHICAGHQLILFFVEVLAPLQQIQPTEFQSLDTPVKLQNNGESWFIKFSKYKVEGTSVKQIL